MAPARAGAWALACIPAPAARRRMSALGRPPGRPAAALPALSDGRRRVIQCHTFGPPPTRAPAPSGGLRIRTRTAEGPPVSMAAAAVGTGAPRRTRRRDRRRDHRSGGAIAAADGGGGGGDDNQTRPRELPHRGAKKKTKEKVAAYAVARVLITTHLAVRP